MTSMIRTHYGITFDDYSVTYRHVDAVDNDGEPCEHCDTIGAVVSQTIYGTSRLHAGEDWLVGCCADCAERLVVNYADASYDVVVERSDAAAVADDENDDFVFLANIRVTVAPWLILATQDWDTDAA